MTSPTDTPILHHYPPSLFSEKVRSLLGYLTLPWLSVIIPPIMPRPHLMPLSGGYRKTPIMQIGADVYCDSEIICRTLAAYAGDRTVYQHGFAAERFARWADTELFRTTVALNFRPEAIATQMSTMSEADIQAFAKDRAELSGSDELVRADPAVAQAHFCSLLENLEHSLQTSFLFGDTPCIADFSLYHCLWFVAGNQANASLFEGYPAVNAYLERMAAFGHGTPTALDAAEALQIGTTAQPAPPTAPGVHDVFGTELQAGDQVAVTPDDYGRFAVTGTLLAWQPNEIVIKRVDEAAGELNVHFPNIGFGVTKA